MRQLYIFLTIALCTLSGAYAELAISDDKKEPTATWEAHEYPSEDFPSQYTHNECTVSIWKDEKKMVLQAYQLDWCGKRLSQMVVLKKDDNGEVHRMIDHRWETDLSKKSLGLDLDVLGYDVFGEHCLKVAEELPEQAKKVFQDLYRPNEIK